MFSSALPFAVLGEYVVSRLRCRVTRRPTLRVVALRWRAGQVARPERVGFAMIFKYGVPPSAAVCKALAVLHHEVHILQVPRYRCSGKELILLRRPMNFGH